ncbi:MAG: FAD-dependent oxidoreductase, partial [Clostridia bacterium]
TFSALRLGAQKVTLLYRRGREEMPARQEEILHAEEEGVEFRLLSAPIEILGKEKVEGIRCIKTELIQSPDESRKTFQTISGSEFDLACDQIIISVGTSPNPLIKETAPSLKTDARGIIQVDENGQTSIDRVYAGGDATTGAATVILAMGAGKHAARSILKRFFLKNKN